MGPEQAANLLCDKLGLPQHKAVQLAAILREFGAAGFEAGMNQCREMYERSFKPICNRVASGGPCQCFGCIWTEFMRVRAQG